MPPDNRTKYDVNIAVDNGQAFNLITLMPLKAIEDELDLAREDGRMAKIDAVNPYSDAKVDVRLDAARIIGIVYREWVRPPNQQTHPSLVQ